MQLWRSIAMTYLVLSALVIEASSTRQLSYMTIGESSIKFENKANLERPRLKLLLPDCDVADEKQLNLLKLAYKHSCSAVARSLRLPKVALLFMVQSDMPHERLWNKWLGELAGSIPIQSFASECGEQSQFTWPALVPSNNASQQEAAAATNLEAEQWRLCTALMNSNHTTIYYKQFLFSIYVHAMHGFDGFAPSSIFYKREIPHHIPAQRLSHTLVLVEKFLIEQALKDPLNQRFVFLSESQIPLYPAATVYMQFVHEPLARINACPPTEDDLKTDSISMWRWKAELCLKEQWRKSEHWISMTRKVATIFQNEHEIQSRFIQHCRRYCSNIEHYIPTMLSLLGYENETSCVSSTTYVDWSNPNNEGRPKTFTAKDLTVHSLQKFRATRCPSKMWAAVQSAQQSIVDIRNVTGPSLCSVARTPMSYATLDSQCKLFVRKVNAGAADQAYKLLETYHFEEWYWYASNELQGTP